MIGKMAGEVGEEEEEDAVGEEELASDPLYFFWIQTL